MPELSAGTSTKVIYIDDTTGELIKGDAPSGGLSAIASDSILSNSTTSSAIPTELQIPEERVVGRLTGGHVTPIEIVDIYNLSQTTKDCLSNTSNWSSKSYNGGGITDGDAGKEYYDSDYYFKFVADNVPIRMCRY